jgi:hypothetical protein
MKPLAVLAAAAVLAVILWLTLGRSETRTEGAAPGTDRPLLPALAADCNAVGRIVVTDNAGTLEIRKDGGAWRIPARGDAPADIRRVRELVVAAAYMQASQPVDAAPAQYGRLRLLPPGHGAESGVDVKFFFADGKPAGHLILGKEHAAPAVPGEDDSGMGGRFVLIPETGTAALVKLDPGVVGSSPGFWLERILPAAPEPAAITLQAGDAVLWSLSRPAGGGELRLDERRPGEIPDATVVRLTAAGNWLCLADVAGKAADTPAVEAEFRRTVRVREFSGVEFTFRLGDATPDGRYVRAMANVRFVPSSRPPVPGETAAAAAKAETLHATRQEAARHYAETMAGRTSGWIYLLDAGALKSLPVNREAFLKPAAQPVPEVR